MSNLFIALLLTDITGTLFYLIALLFKRKGFRYHTGFLRFLIIATLCAYTVPFVYTVLYMSRRIAAVRNLNSNINIFYNTLTTRNLFALLGIAWTVMFLLLLAYRLYRRGRWARVCRGNVHEENAEVEQCFFDVCSKLGIEGRVALRRNDTVEVPCMTYYHGPVVILPFRKYTRQQAEVILYHELCHYIERDVFLKTWGVLVSQLHVFNPAVHILLRQMDLICELCCDRMACEKGKEVFGMKTYYNVILEMILTEGKKERYQMFSLVDTRSGFERRVAFMSEYRAQRCIKKGTALLVSACFLLGSSMTALAAGDELANAYVGVTEETIDRTVLEDIEGIDNTSDVDAEALEELCRAYDLDPDTVDVMDDAIQPRGRNFSVKWRVPAGRTYLTSGFTEDVGDEVTIMVAAEQEDITFQTGVKDPTETLRYVEGQGTITRTIQIEIAGRYYFFVTNLSETDYLDILAIVSK